MKKILLVIVCIAIGYCIGYITNYNETKQLQESNDFKREMISSYEDYYDAVEYLLDSLECQFNWIDAYDAYEYYETRQKLDSLYQTEL